MKTPSEFEQQLQHLINRYSMENESNTPDFILAQFLKGCLESFNTAVQQRETWYGRDARPSFSTNGEKCNCDMKVCSVCNPTGVGSLKPEGDFVVSATQDSPHLECSHLFKAPVQKNEHGRAFCIRCHSWEKVEEAL